MPIYTHVEARGGPQVFKNVCPCDPWELNPDCRSLWPIQAIWQTQAKTSTPLSQGYLFPVLRKSSEGCGLTGMTVKPPGKGSLVFLPTRCSSPCGGSGRMPQSVLGMAFLGIA